VKSHCENTKKVTFFCNVAVYEKSCILHHFMHTLRPITVYIGLAIKKKIGIKRRFADDREF